MVQWYNGTTLVKCANIGDNSREKQNGSVTKRIGVDARLILLMFTFIRPRTFRDRVRIKTISGRTSTGLEFAHEYDDPVLKRDKRDNGINGKTG